MLDAETILKVVQTIPALGSIVRVLTRKGKPVVSIKHLVVKSDFVVKRLLEGNFQSFYEEVHARRVYMQENEVSTYLRSVQRDHVTQKIYASWEQTPVGGSRDPLDHTYERTPDIQELSQLGKQHDPMITARIVADFKESGKDVEPGDFCRISYFGYGCGEEVAEMIEFRPLWLVMLWIENLSDDTVEVGDYSGTMYYPNTELDYRGLSFGGGEYYQRDIPLNVLQREESILIPELLLLTPLDPYASHLEQEVRCDHYEGELDFLYAFTPLRTGKAFHLIGPSLSVSEVSVGNRAENVHQFDITNTLTLSDLIETGCCPYVIGYSNGGFRCVRDVLSNGPERVEIHGFDYVVIAEIEHEITHLSELSVWDGASSESILFNRMLRRGDFLILRNPNRRYRVLSIEGDYSAERGNAENRRALVWKYQNLRRFISGLNGLGLGSTWFQDEPCVMSLSDARCRIAPPSAGHIRPTHCPTNAITARHFTDEQIDVMIDSLLVWDK